MAHLSNILSRCRLLLHSDDLRALGVVTRDPGVLHGLGGTGAPLWVQDEAASYEIQEKNVRRWDRLLDLATLRDP